VSGGEKLTLTKKLEVRRKKTEVGSRKNERKIWVLSAELIGTEKILLNNIKKVE